ncbi:MAG TPA: DUF3043 domain-containing protein [Nocardioides sp.]|uniref:DUF3043 domain-containing protein n=1 Tax=Nocardioides sp. TaxID=35761 RepID=UPI002D7FC0C2|nr:DUF3043 domain-containing protein [Nocardioides sp.]HET6654039.1 DUF3043 domain-containing protein [Nocardioides sp.]
MFRRTKTDETATTTTTAPVKEGGKGRPTPSRKEAEAAARARAKAPRDKKAAKALLREQRASQNAKMREGLKTGDERFLPARDQGKVKRFVRDFVDVRVAMAEFLLPLLVIIMVSQAINPAFANGLWMATILLVTLDTFLMIFKLRREVRRRFPDESHKGVTSYAVLRSLQMRWLRLPKRRVKLGQKLPERY